MIFIKVHVLLTSSDSVETEERRPAQGHHVPPVTAGWAVTVRRP